VFATSLSESELSDAWQEGDESARWRSACVPHDVRNADDEVLRFVAVYAANDVMTTYEREVQPAGARERDPLG
jgi:hypothetical protein